ncbi:MAG: hypothetical protein U9P80_00350 [Thermodesulfobacteriota bacterium]|nr:hypothetical protein [Thermodesulfobacteriota bacterium]
MNRLYLEWLCIIGVMILVMSGCGADSDHSTAPATTASGTTEANTFTDTPENGSIEELEEILSKQGLCLEEQVKCTDPDSGKTYTGYKAAFEGKFSEGVYGYYDDLEHHGPVQKYGMILSGSPYSIGYQSGYLQPEGLKQMTTTFVEEALLAQFGMLGIPIEADTPEGDAVFEFFYNKAYDLCIEELARINMVNDSSTIPLYMIEEMHGLVQGANDAIKDKGLDIEAVEFVNVFAINEGIDALFTLIANWIFQSPDPGDVEELRQILQGPGVSHGDDIIITPDNRILFPKIKELPFPQFGCNGFVIGNDITADNKTYHGRDFMFATGGVYQDLATITIYLPGEGYPEDSLAFAAISAPGWVGQPVGINAEGLSLGVDISITSAFASKPGVGCLMVVRDMLQHKGNLKDAIARTKQFQRGMPWIYALGDDQDDPDYGYGAVIEAGRSNPNFTGPDVLPEWEQWLLKGMPVDLGDMVIQLGPDLITPLGEELPERGIMVRGSHWELPDAYTNVNITLPIDDPFYEDQGRFDVGFTFPDPIEKDDNILCVTNHNMIPRMRMAQMHPIVLLGYGIGPLPESIWRYETMLGRIEEFKGDICFFNAPDTAGGTNISGYTDRPDQGSAAWIIDFLNTTREGEYNTHFYEHYGKPIDGEIEGHHVIMNNTDRELRALFGYMTDPWVGVQLMPFVDWWEARSSTASDQK